MFDFRVLGKRCSHHHPAHSAAYVRGCGTHPDRFVVRVASVARMTSIRKPCFEGVVGAFERCGASEAFTANQVEHGQRLARLQVGESNGALF